MGLVAIAHSEIYKGYRIEIVEDKDGEGPDRWENTDLFLVYDHRQFHVKREGFDPNEIFNEMGPGDPDQFKGYWVLPLYAYIHSGVVLSFTRGNDRWDTSFKGFVLASVKDWPEKDKAIEVGKSLIKEWNLYLQGSIYGYRIYKGDSEDEVNACWNFICEPTGYILDEARLVIDGYGIIKSSKPKK